MRATVKQNPRVDMPIRGSIIIVKILKVLLSIVVDVHGFEGNPYLEDGCQGGAIFFTLLLVGNYMLYKCIRKRKANKRKEILFRKNGGHLLQNNIAKFKGAINSIKIFTAEEMEKATDSFNNKNIIGHGGFGIVYKGYLPEFESLAIKKPKTMDQTQTEQLINEVVLLSKIHHQNVVAFLGCCLEMDVPLLVYEFVANGTLHDHLHDETKQRILQWVTRLKIAAETAGVLAYLHNNHRPPVIHRDVKPANILLDGNYNTKVADFCSSRLVPQNDETKQWIMQWGTHLIIAGETIGVLVYLHNNHRPPVIHRDAT